ncbi:MAG: MOSC domain-containing protein YiiM [Candidatus Latescibacterota bacterium]|jgi:MOSC domain-containing protein YiiM
MTTISHLTTAELEAGLDEIRQSPSDNGTLEMLIRRAQIGAREQLEEGEIDLVEGLVGDNWKTRYGDRPANPDAQITITNARAIQHISQDKDRWALAGDQLYADFDLSEANVPAGTQLSLGSAILEVTAEPHNGCKKFVERFGMDAMTFVNSEVGKELHLRGINCKVIQAGTISVGDSITKI